MAKMNKIMPPRNTTIRGQDHLLAYITPEEAQMLMDNGGSGKAGPMGIPAFYDDSGEEGGGYSNADADQGYGGGDYGGGGDAAQSTMDRATEKDYGTPDPTSQDIEAGRGFDFGSPASKAMEQSFASGFNQLGGYSVSGRELDRAFGQLDARMANAKANYGLPSVSIVGHILGKIGMMNLNNIKSGLEKGHMPAFDKAGNIQGVFGPDPFGFGGLVYSGNPIEGNEATGWSDPTEGGDGYDDRPQTVPVNPATGQCDAGYMFDEDMQACRLDTGFDASGEDGGVAPESGAYARMGLLDQAPTGLPEFQQQYGAGFGTPSQFTDANLAFRRRGAYRPQYFDQPYPTTGYTLLS